MTIMGEPSYDKSFSRAHKQCCSISSIFLNLNHCQGNGMICTVQIWFTPCLQFNGRSLDALRRRSQSKMLHRELWSMLGHREEELTHRAPLTPKALAERTQEAQCSVSIRASAVQYFKWNIVKCLSLALYPQLLLSLSLFYFTAAVSSLAVVTGRAHKK